MANNPITPDLTGWVVYNPDNKAISPVEDELLAEESRNRVKIVDALGSLQRDLTAMGFNEVIGSGRLKPAKLGATTVPRLYFSVVRSADRNPYAAYVTVKDGLPVVLHVSRIDGSVSTVEKMSATASNRLAVYEERQHAQALQSDVTRIERVAVVTPGAWTVEASATGADPAVADLRTYVPLDEDQFRPLITAKQDIASFYERLISEREYRRREIDEGLSEELDIKVTNLAKALHEVQQARAAIRIQTETDRSSGQELQPEPAESSVRRRLRDFFGANKPAEPTTSNDGVSPELRALEATLDNVIEEEQQASADLRNVELARHQLKTIDITELAVIERLDDDGAERIVAGIVAGIETVRSLGLKLGHELLSNNQYDIPVLHEALGRQLEGRPDDSSTWGNGRNRSRSEAQALLAADLAAFHLEHGISFRQPAYGVASTYKGEGPQALYSHRTDALMSFQSEARSQGLNRGAGIDPARITYLQVGAETRAIADATLGDLPGSVGLTNSHTFAP